MPFGRMGGLALLFLLIAAEAVTVLHSLDYDAHVGADPCKICISISALDDFVPASAPVLVPPAAFARDVFPESDAAILVRIERPNVRGPPQAS